MISIVHFQLSILHCVCGVVVQLVRTPACHVGGRGFESRRLRHPIAVSTLPGSHPFGWLNFLKFRQNHPPKSVVKREGFIPGLRLSELLFQQQVRPILDKHFPQLRYSAALIGWGSEVLAFDTPLSRDHHWGPRVLLFLSEQDYPRLHRKISNALSLNLPYDFMGYSTNFSKPEPNGVRHPIRIKSGRVNHMINIYTVRAFIKARLGIDLNKPITTADWLTLPQQRLLELTSGAVYHDGLGELKK